MAIEHAAPGEAIDLNTFGPDGDDTHSVALVKTEGFEAIRTLVQAGSTVPPHSVEGPITVQCLRGTGTFFVGEDSCPLRPGTWLHLDGGQTHSIHAETDCVLLVTILFVA